MSAQAKKESKKRREGFDELVYFHSEKTKRKNHSFPKTSFGIVTRSHSLFHWAVT
jgi:hypothetical protein